MTLRDARNLVAAGDARWKRQRMAGDRIVDVRSEIVLVERRHRLHDGTIEAHDIIAAFVEDVEYARRRIEEFGPEKAR